MPEPASAASTTPSITLTRAATGKLVMAKGKKYSIGAVATTGKLSFKSSASKKVSVSKKGVLKAKKVGKATITITAKKGTKKATKKLKVTVVKPKKFKKVKKLSAKLKNSSIQIGAKTTVKVSFTPKNPSNKNVIYKSSKPSVATVTTAGKVSAKKAGTAKITVTSCDNAKAKKTVKLTVKQKSSSEAAADEKDSYEKLIDLVQSGRVEATSTDGETVDSMYGPFTDKKARTVAEAAAVLNDSAELFGEQFAATAAEIQKLPVTLDGETLNTFLYSPQVNGVPVEGHQIVLTANSAGEVQALTSTYDDDVRGVDTKATISQNNAIAKAVGLASAASGLDQSALSATAELLVSCSSANASPALAYRVRVKASTASGFAGQTYYLYANDSVGKAGESFLVIDFENAERPAVPSKQSSAESNLGAASALRGGIAVQADDERTWESRSVEATDYLGTKRQLRAQFDGDSTFRLRDDDRNIETNAVDRVLVDGEYQYVMPGHIVEFDLSALDPIAVSLHANMEETYDFYNNVLHRDSFDGNGALVLSTYGEEDYYNAFWSGEQFYFGLGDAYAAALDVVAHEYTHAVSGSIVGGGRGLTYENESGALNESYSDIMGSIVEGKDLKSDDRWNIGEDDGTTMRSMANKLTYGERFVLQEGEQPSGDNDQGGVHHNSGIFNHAAYLMMTDERTQDVSNETWAKVFYLSMRFLSSDSDLNAGRNAVMIAARLRHFTADQVQAVREAFQAVGLGPAVNTAESLLEILDEQSGKNILGYCFEDFDRDFDFEMYAVTSNDGDLSWMEDADVWYVDENGATKMDSGLTGFVLGEGLASSRGYKFFVFEETYGGSGGASHVYGSRFRIPKKMLFLGYAFWKGSATTSIWNSEDVMYFQDGAGNAVIANPIGCFANGIHEYPTMTFTLDKTLFKFILVKYEKLS